MELPSFHCPRWEELPALSLYMDQVLIVLEEGLSPLFGGAEPAATAAMVNNYVKLKLVAAPGNKKYGREHIARLMMICVLKRAFSISEIAGLLALLTRQREMRDAYDLFCQKLEARLAAAFGQEGERAADTATDPARQALDAALDACARKLLVQRILAAEAPAVDTKKHK